MLLLNFWCYHLNNGFIQESTLLVWNSFLWMRPIVHGMFWFTDWITLSCEVLCAAVEVAAGLLHCEVSELMTALSTRKIRAGGDDILQRLTYEQVGYSS